MKVLNFGSLNIDLVYRVRDFVRPGETIPALSFARFAGGKGLNQSLAAARAGARVVHAGAVGDDGGFLLDILRDSGVDCSAVTVDPESPSGHAVIQVADSGENSIVLFPGANHRITPELVARALSCAEAGDILLLQNEISAMPEIMREAAARRMRIFINPAPMTPAVAEYPLELVDTLIVNETEAEALAGCRLPEKVNVLKTLGARGAVYNDTIHVRRTGWSRWWTPPRRGIRSSATSSRGCCAATRCAPRWRRRPRPRRGASGTRERRPRSPAAAIWKTDPPL